MKENKNKLLLLLIALLLIANISLLVLFLQSKKQRGRQDRKAYIAAFLKTEIGFTPEQLAKFDTMSDHHRERVAAVIDREKTGKPEQFKQLVAADFSDSVMNVVALKSAETQKITDALMFEHMRNIRNLCQPNQRPAFDSLFARVLTRRGETARKKNQ